MILESNTDAFLMAIPMVALLVAGFFRLDELFARNTKSQGRRRMAGLDERGLPVCLDPDGRQFRRGGEIATGANPQNRLIVGIRSDPDAGGLI